MSLFNCPALTASEIASAGYQCHLKLSLGNQNIQASCQLVTDHEVFQPCIQKISCTVLAQKLKKTIPTILPTQYLSSRQSKQTTTTTVFFCDIFMLPYMMYSTYLLPRYYGHFAQTCASIFAK